MSTINKTGKNTTSSTSQFLTNFKGKISFLNFNTPKKQIKLHYAT